VRGRRWADPRAENPFAQVAAPTYPCRYMTNAPDHPAADFTLRDALAATRGWDDDTIRLDDELLEDGLDTGLEDDLEDDLDDDLDGEFESGYADEDYDETDPEELTVGAQELAERHALRRVASLRTELEDITEVEYRQLRLEKVVLVGVWTEGSVTDAENSMAELALLAETAGSEVLEAVFQRRQKPDPATYIGRGKVEAIREIVQASGADTVICDGELAPSQLRNLEDRIKVKVVDRTALILDIFAQHAKSKEGQAQVELAQLQYMKQRLRGWGGNLSRQAGGRAAGGEGIGGRGPGETKIETDRRRINTKIAKLRRELKEMRGTRDVKRQSRRRNHIPSVAIAGYTNAGKSSLLNRLTDAGVLVEDALFATLDPTTRRTTTSDGRIYTMSDTVGFVRHLPHDLVEAFRSTLEEVADSDLLLHVVDGSHPDPEGQIAAVRLVLAEIGATKVPEIIVINKADAADPLVISRLRAREPHSVVVSAKTGEGIEEALRVIESELPRPQVEFDVLLPYERGDLVNRIHQEAEIGSLEHTGDGTLVAGRANADLAGELAAYTR
jgi:GTPase